MVDPDHSFHIADYAVFAVTIFVSLSIGIYYALSGDRQRTTSEYLVGGRSMKVLPLAISLVVSFESSIMMLGNPSEAYVYGMQFALTSLGLLTSFILSTFIMVPLLHPLKLTSVFEYFQYRYNSSAVRLLGSFMGIVSNVWYMGVVVYGPAIALEAVTGFSQWSSMIVVAFVAIVYTTIGGIKAVVWTDVFQALIMYSGILVILMKGTLDVGGANKVWDVASTGGRMNLFNFDLDPTTRHTFWNIYIGTSIRGMNTMCSQSTVQRISSTKTVKQAIWVMLLSAPVVAITPIVSCYEGIVAYAYYQTAGCDPLASNKITNPNQIIPFTVMDIFRSAPGLPGLFLASLFSASLSTLSSGLSSLSALMWVDFIKPRIGEVSEFKATIIAKLCVVFFGLISVALALIVSVIGGPLSQIAVVVISAATGPLLGMFFLSCMFPVANAKGAFVGPLLSLIFSVWLSMGMNFNKNIKKQPWLPPASTAMCWANESLPLFNTTAVPSANHIHPFLNTTASNVDMSSNYGFTTLGNFSHQDDQTVRGLEVMYTLSYQWLATVGSFLSIFIGLLVSLITGGNREGVDPRYIVPFCDRFCGCLPRCVRKMFSCKNKYLAVKDQDGALYDLPLDNEVVIMKPTNKSSKTQSAQCRVE